MNADTLELLCRPSPHFLAYKKAYEQDIKMAREPYAYDWRDWRRGISTKERDLMNATTDLVKDPKVVETVTQLPQTMKGVNNTIAQLQKLIANNPQADMAAYKDEIVKDMKDHISNEIATTKKDLMGGGDGAGFQMTPIMKFIGDNWPLFFGALAAGGGGYALDRAAGGNGIGGAVGTVGLLGLLYYLVKHTEGGKMLWDQIINNKIPQTTAITQQQTEQQPLEGTQVTAYASSGNRNTATANR
jgi:hypothetical protein